MPTVFVLLSGTENFSRTSSGNIFNEIKEKVGFSILNTVGYLQTSVAEP
jgi:hypothetical protein